MSQYQHTELKKVLGVKAQFLAEVEFGIPSCGCKNFGICKINPVGDEKAQNNCSEKRVIAVTTIFNNNRLDLDFLNSSITPQSYQKNFADKKFIVQENYHFFYDTEPKIDINIKPGIYKVEERPGFIKVIFTP